MSKTNKLIGIVKLDIFSLILTIIFCIFGFKIYYLTVGNLFRKISVIKFLENLNFFWLSYENFEEKGKNLINKNNSRRIANKISKRITKEIWNGEIKKKIKKKTFLSVCIYERLLKEVSLLNELSCQLRNLTKHKNIYVWNYQSEFINFYLNYDKKIKNLCPWFLFDLSMFLRLFTYTIKFLLKKLFTISFGKTNSFHKKKIDYSSYKYAFFPKGIIEGNPKDYFMSSKKNIGPTNKNLIVIELEKKEIEGRHLKYLIKKNLNYSLWNELGSSIEYKIVLENILIFLKVYLQTKSIFLSKLIFKILITNEKNLIKFKKFNKLEYLLVGHEELVPFNIKVSALIKNIKVIANQTRVKLSFPFVPIIEKYYLTFSKKLGEFAKKNNFQLKQTRFLSVGNYKHNSYKNFSLKILKTKLKKNYKIICLVWDYPSQKSWYLNGRESIGNYKRNKILLNEVLKFAELFPKIIFIIKSKNLNYLKIDNFKEISSKIKKKKKYYDF